VTFFRRALSHPQQLWLRRLNFQIHLWAGIVLAIYAVLIGVTGSILVFRAELQRFINPSSWRAFGASGARASLNGVVEQIRLQYPHTHIISLMAPTPAEPVFVAVLQKRPPIRIACHPLSGAVLTEIQPRPSLLSLVADLHENLLAKRTGRIVNGTASIALLLILFTGLVNWWPGTAHWRRALTVDFRRKWKRVTFDLHSAAGFWSLWFLLMWSITGIYFTWPNEAVALIRHISLPVNSVPPDVRIDPLREPVKLDFDNLLHVASTRERGAQFEGIIFPVSRRAPLEILLTHSADAPRNREDFLYFDPYTGRYLATWHYGANQSLGDWMEWLQTPLHFGTHWGLAVKVIWAFFGLMFPVLAVTGLLMYWNRVLGKQWVRLRSRRLTEVMQESTDGEAPTSASV
jgi:uncharacterized iron-regulated membrane protein